MKNTLATLFLSFLLTGCSHQNAFTKFNLPTEEELSFSSQQDTPIYKNKEVTGAFSAVYLNEVSPELYNEKEYFLVSIYLKDNQVLETFENYEQVRQEMLWQVEMQEWQRLEDIEEERLKEQSLVEEEIYTTEEDTTEEITKGVFLLLNHKYPLTIEPLPQELQKHISLNADWNSYYLVIFEESRENTMRISLSGDSFHTKNLTYYKNEE